MSQPTCGIWAEGQFRIHLDDDILKWDQTIDDPADGDGLVPIDGGVSMLLAAAAGLGAYRTARRQK
jgi:hypothetical protein